jgi:hypothetical protein
MKTDNPKFFKINEDELWVVLPKNKHRSCGRVYRWNKKTGNELFTELQNF